MRMLKIICGMAVILASLHLAHAIHHFEQIAVQGSMQGPIFWAGIVFACVVSVLSLIGGVLLVLRR